MIKNADRFQISTAEHWWFFDIWRRLHPQMNWEDIFMRMEVPNRDEDRDRLFQNSVQTGIGRKWHKRYHMVAASWFGTGRGAEQATKRVHEALQAANIPTNLNTTRGVTPGPVDPRQPNGRHVAHPDLRERRYNPRGRKQRRARARSSNDVSEDEDISELRGASEDNATTGEQPGEGSLAARTNATPSLSPAPEDAIASRLRSGSRRISPPATSFTPVNVPEPSRRRSTPKSSAPKSKPSENRIVKQQTTKKLRPITFPPCPTANLQARMLESGMSGHEFDSLVARTLAPIEGEYGPSRPVSTPRRQHRTNMDATDSPMYDSQAENRPARRTNPAPIEPATRPMGPPVTPSRRVPGYPRGGNSYGPPLPDYTEAVVQRHPSLQDNLPAFPIPPVAPMYTPAAFRFGTAYATAQQFDFRIQYPLPEAHTDAPMPAPRQPPDYQGEAYASSPQVHDVNEVRGSSLSDRSVDNTCRQDSTGYEPRDSHFESDGIFHEYEGW